MGRAELRVGIVAVVAAVYFGTLYPSIPGGDSGELVAEACELGIAHPPGYPLFTLLGHAATWINTGSPAWRVNAMNAVLATLAAVLLFEIVVSITHGTRHHSAEAAACAAVLFAFSPLIWLYAIGSEVFALNNALAALLLLLTVRFSKTGSMTAARLGAMVCGLGLANQHTIVLFIIPCVAWVAFLLHRARALTARVLLELATCGAAALSLYLYLPLSWHLNGRPGTWGDLGSVGGIIHHLRRGDYGTLKLYSADRPAAGLWGRLWLYAIDFASRQVPATLLLPLVAAGAAMFLWPPWLSLTVEWQQGSPSAVAAGSKHHAPHARMHAQEIASRYTGAALAATFAFYMLVFHSLSNMPLDEPLLYGVHARFWQQPNILAFAAAGVAMSAAAAAAMRLLTGERAPQLSDTVASGKPARSWRRRPARLCLRVCFVALCAMQGARWRDALDHSATRYMERYAKAIMDPLPQGALLLTNYDHQWTSIRYLHVCEGYRSDLTVINLSMMTYSWFAKQAHRFHSVVMPGQRPYLQPAALAARAGGFSFADLVRANIDRLPGIFVGGEVPHEEDEMEDGEFSFLNLGLARQVVRSGAMPSAREYAAQSEAAWRAVHRALPALPPEEKYDDETWEAAVPRDYWYRMGNRGTQLLELALLEGKDVMLLAQAALTMEAVVANERPQFVRSNVYKNLGLAYVHMAQSNTTLPRRVDPFALTHVQDGLPALFQPLGARPAATPALAGVSWRDFAATGVLKYWSQFLETKGAEKDKDFHTIKHVVKVLIDAAQAKQ